MLLLVRKVVDEALKPRSPSSEKDRSDALLFCLDSRGKMILTGVQEDLSLESAGEQSTIIMTMNIRTPGAGWGWTSYWMRMWWNEGQLKQVHGSIKAATEISAETVLCTNCRSVTN